MKKYFAFLLCLIMLLSLFSCDTANKIKDTENDTANTEASDKDNGTKDSEPTDKPTTDINKQYYKIEKIELTKVRYYIYDSNGNIVLSDETDRPLDISMLGDNIVDIRISMGTGISIHKYYDVENNRFSEEYSYVAAASGNLVAYIDTSMDEPMLNRTLVVRDIFDKNVFYKSFVMDFSPTVDTPIEYAKFTENENELILIYLTERPPIPFSQILPIRCNEVAVELEALNDALNNKINVYNTASKKYYPLCDIPSPYMGIPLARLKDLSYAYVDIDTDGKKELIIDCDDTLILRYYEGTVYAYPLTFRNLYHLKTDGSYAWNHTGEDFEYGESKIYFEDAELKTKENYRIINDGEPNAEYYIEGKQVTQEEILKYIEDNPKAKIEFAKLKAFWQNDGITETEAIQIAKEYWARYDIEKTKYLVEHGVNSRAPSSVYVIIIRQLVMDIHYSTFDEIWIDRDTGEVIIPYDPDGKG